MKIATSDYNNTQHSTIKMALYKAKFGKNCVDHLPSSVARFKQSLVAPIKLNNLDEILRERIKKNAEDMAQKFNCKKKPVEYKIGDKVCITSNKDQTKKEYVDRPNRNRK